MSSGGVCAPETSLQFCFGKCHFVMAAGTLNRSSSLYVSLQTPSSWPLISLLELSCNTYRESMKNEQHHFSSTLNTYMSCVSMVMNLMFWLFHSYSLEVVTN